MNEPLERWPLREASKAEWGVDTVPGRRDRWAFSRCVYSVVICVLMLEKPLREDRVVIFAFPKLAQSLAQSESLVSVEQKMDNILAEESSWRRWGWVGGTL